MKHLIRILMILMMIMFFISFFNFAFAIENNIDLLHNVIQGNADSKVTKPITGFAKSAIVITQVIGVGMAVIMLIILGMKYMVSAPDDKAQIKKHAVVYVIGAVVLFGATGILELIKNIAGAAKS